MKTITVKVGDALRDCDGRMLYVVADMLGHKLTLVERDNPEDREDEMFDAASKVRKLHQHEVKRYQRKKSIDRQQVQG